MLMNRSEENKKAVKSYVDESLYCQLRETAHILDISMSRLIAEALHQGIEMIAADVNGREPKIVSKPFRDYMIKHNIPLPNEHIDT